MRSQAADIASELLKGSQLGLVFGEESDDGARTTESAADTVQTGAT
jgi:hypothetical protein